MLSAITANCATPYRRCCRPLQQGDGRFGPRAGISIKEVTDKLTTDGVKLFADAFDKLLAAVEKSTQQKVEQQKGKTA